MADAQLGSAMGQQAAPFGAIEIIDEPEASVASQRMGQSPPSIKAEIASDSAVSVKAAEVSARLGELARSGYLDEVRRCVEEGASLRWQNEFGQNLMLLAMQRRKEHAPEAERIARFFIEAGVDLDVPDKRMQTPLFFAASGGLSAAAALLLRQRACPNAADKIAQTPLFYAARHGHFDCLRLLLDARADAGSRDVHRQLPIFYSARHGHGPCTRALAAAPSKVPVSSPDNRGQTALFCVKDVDSCAVLLACRCDANTVDTSRQTATFYAAKAGATDILRLLLEARANTNARDQNSDTPLFYAALQGHRAACSMLVDVGSANPRFTNRIGLTPAKVAADRGHSDLSGMLQALEALVGHPARRRLAAEAGLVDGPRRLRPRIAVAGAAGGNPQASGAVQAGAGAAGEREKYYIAFMDPSDPEGERFIPFGTPEYLSALRRLCDECPLLSLSMWPAGAQLTTGPPP